MREGDHGRGLAARLAVSALVAATLAVGVSALTAGATPAARTAAAEQTACGVATKPGDHLLRVRSQGRVYRVPTHLPSRYSGRHRLPLVLNLHGSTHDGASQQRLTGMSAVADRNAFIVVAPNGGIRLPRGYAWNVPGVPLANGSAVPRDARDDVRFLADTVRAVARGYCLDPDRVYVTGHSGGARMASALACERADMISGLAAVSGLRAGRPDRGTGQPDPATCTPSRPVPVLSFHGDADELNPYHGGGGPYWGYSVPAAMRAWNRINSCTPSLLAVPVRQDVSLRRSTNCQGGSATSSYLVHGGGHTWPGSRYNGAGTGPTTHQIDASRTIWSFFARHHR